MLALIALLSYGLPACLFAAYGVTKTGKVVSSIFAAAVWPVAVVIGYGIQLAEHKKAEEAYNQLLKDRAQLALDLIQKASSEIEVNLDRITNARNN
jgi:hypothetical protein